MGFSYHFPAISQAFPRHFPAFSFMMVSKAMPGDAIFVLSHPLMGHGSAEAAASLDLVNGG
jgi:hypothetical protein